MVHVRIPAAAAGVLSVLLLSGVSVVAQSEAPADGDVVQVTAIEYAYTGLPTSLPAGTSLGMTNAGAEVHELVLVRIGDDVTATLEELLAMPEEESNKLVSFLGVAVASPGESAPETITLDQPGSYIFLCFIPVGTTTLPSLAPDATPNESLLPDGPPHFVQGMVAEFSVTG